MLAVYPVMLALNPYKAIPHRFFTFVQNDKTNKINQQYYFIEKGLRFAIWEIIKEQKKNPCSEINREECLKLYE